MAKQQDKQAADEPLKVEVVSPLQSANTPDEDQKKVLQAQADQMYGKAADHAPAKPQRLDHVENGGASFGAPVAQGMNLSKEEEEFASNVAKSGEGENQPEKTPASKEVE